MALPYIMRLGNIRTPTNTCLRIRTIGQITESNGGKGPVVNTFYYYWGGGTGNPRPNQSQKSALVTTASTGFVAKVATPMLAALNVRYTMNQINVHWMDNFLDSDLVIIPDGYPSPGLVTGTGLPSTDCVTIEKVTGIGSHHFHGSWHFRSASVSDAASTAGDWLSSGAQTNFEALATGLIANITDGTSTLEPFLFCNKLWTDPKFEERARGENAAVWEAELQSKYPNKIAGALISAVNVQKQFGSFRKGRLKPTTYVSA